MYLNQVKRGIKVIINDFYILQALFQLITSCEFLTIIHNEQIF